MDDSKKRRPRQKRSESTRNKIIESGKRLFSEDGYHGTSSKKIAREAGIAIGSFYNYFANKKELLLEVYRLHVVEVHNMVSGSLSKIDFTSPDLDGRALMEGIVEQTRQLHDLSPDLHRQLTALAHSDTDFQNLKSQEEDRIVGMIIELLKPHRKVLRVKDLEAATIVLTLSLEAVIHTIKMFDTPIEEERLTKALADMLYRYLYKV
ncbi:MAG: TetR/AcrR family transcriptional regulator [Proteobacteria bacterium]|nr:TetR/AcrR family transcriptional regulator [Pseudomonadota bacterium]